MEVAQNLGRDIAKNTVHNIGPLLNSADIKLALQDIMHSMMVINPGVEVYHLDLTGNILNFVAPDKVVQLKKVSIEPIKSFLSQDQPRLILGDDPRHPSKQNIFSVAPILNNELINGYIYIILASDLYASEENTLSSSYLFKSIVRSVLITLAIAAILGLIAIYVITRKLNKVIDSFKLFQKGNLDTRMENVNGELKMVSTTFNEMAETIGRNMEELKGVDKLRKELISNISHDLRTPIASIQGFAEILQSKGQQLTVEEKTEYLNVVLKNVDRLKKLVNDLFELSKLESRAVQPNMEPLSIVELITDMASKFRLIANEKGVSINTILSKEIPLAFADIGLLDRALQNLMDNALKFCSQGDVITLELIAEDSGAIRVNISDTGSGISEEDLPLIFDRYYKGKSENSNNGTGLGLAITKKILELHGSDINVQSKINQGTKFSFQLPAFRAA